MPTTSDKADVTINNSFRLAQKYNHEYLTTEHLMYGILSDEHIIEFLAKKDINAKNISEALITYIENDLVDIIKQDVNKPKKTLTIDRIFQRAFAQALVNNKSEVDCFDILASILHENNSPSVYFANSHGLDKDSVKLLIDQQQQDENKEKIQELLDTFCDELVCKIDVNKNYCVSREQELHDMTVTLGRYTKSNVMLVGESGVGKSTLIWGLAEKIAKKLIPSLENYKIYSLNIGKIIAGTRFRGDLEERITMLATAFEHIDQDVIIYLDEIHTLGNSGNDNGMDMLNMLKPMLNERHKIVGSTTNQEFRKYIENDKGFVRRFSVVNIKEPNHNQCFKIVNSTISNYEKYHKEIYIAEPIIDNAIKLSKHWIKNRNLPDSVFDVIDKSMSRKKINYPKDKVLTDADLRYEISQILQIPLENITSKFNNTTDSLQIIDKIKKQVFGQDNAVNKISKYFTINKMGIKDPNKPIGNFLLIGPTGVGKTEVVKSFTSVLGMNLIRFDMSEYQERHSVSKLIGSPPGYVGFNDGQSGSGLLVNKINDNPNSIILFDEIEKAHPDIITVLLQLLDEGTITNSTGKSVDARNCAIFMTSNIGIKDQENNNIGFGHTDLDKINKAVKAFFSPEFRNRLDEIIKFDYLQQNQLEGIVNKFIQNINEILKEQNIKIILDQTVVDYFISKGYSKNMGARPMKRIIDKEVKEKLVEILLNNYTNCNVTFEYKNDQLLYNV